MMPQVLHQQMVIPSTVMPPPNKHFLLFVSSCLHTIIQLQGGCDIMCILN